MSGEIIPYINKIEVPVNQYGVPDREKLMEQVVANVPDGVLWGGQYDLHHVAWPRAEYRGIRTHQDEWAGANYRGTSLLKVYLPRKLHDHVHKATEIPDVPDVDVIEQWTSENRMIGRLYGIIKAERVFENSRRRVPDSWKYNEYLYMVEKMRDGELGVLPDKEVLFEYDLPEAQIALRSLASALRVERDGSIAA